MGPARRSGSSFPTGNFNFNRLATSQPFDSSGGDGFASFLLGLVNDANTTLGPLLDYRSWYYALYFQDDWKVRPGLTINLGLRWDIDAPLREAQYRGNSFDFFEINPVSGTPGVPRFHNTPSYPYKTFYDTDWHRFSPRFGFAWQPLSKTVVRGGYGLYSQSGFLGLQTPMNLGYTTNGSFSTPDGGLTPAFRLQDGFPDYPLGGDPLRLNSSFGAVPVGQAPST